MPPPIKDLVTSSDCLFRDVFSRNQSHVEKTGNLIQKSFHHLDGSVASMSAAQVVSLGGNNEARVDYFLRKSAAPLAAITTADINSSSSVLSLRRGTTTIRSANVVVDEVIATNISGGFTGLDLKPDALTKLDNYVTRSFHKSLSGTRGRTTTICTIRNNRGAYGVKLNVAQSDNKPLVAKMYECTIRDVTVLRAVLIPVSSSSPTDWGVEMSVLSKTATFNLVRLSSASGSTGLECTLTVYQSRSDPVTISTSTATSNSSTVAPLNLDANTVLTQVLHKVGIGTDNPTSTLTVQGKTSTTDLVVGDDILGKYVGATSPVAPATHLSQGAYMAWNRQGDGYTDFICKRGLGQGGFNFYTSSGNGSNFSVGKTLLATLDSNGITMTQGAFESPGSIVGSLFLTGKDTSMNGGVSIAHHNLTRSANGSGYITIATIVYTPQSTSSVLMIRFDDDYLIEGNGSDTLVSRITVDNNAIVLKQQRFGDVAFYGSGTRSNVILPISGVVKNQASSNRTIRIQVDLTNCDDLLKLSLQNWTFELLERHT